MGIFDRFKAKKDTLTPEEEEQFVDFMNNKESKESDEMDIFGYISSISSIHEINKLRNLLDAQERQLTGQEPSYEEIPVSKEKEEKSYKEEYVYNDEVSGQKKESEKYEAKGYQNEESSQDISIKTESETPQESAPSFEIEEVESYTDIEENPKENTQQEESEFSKEQEKMENKLIDLFGEENVFTNSQEQSTIEMVKGKPLCQFGIRQKDSFNEETTIKDENSWFIQTIKQLDILKEFKMVRSEEGIKDLLLDRGDYAIIISFKATQLLSSIKEFDFDL